MPKTVMLIHGAWLNAHSREGYKARYEARGHTTIAVSGSLHDVGFMVKDGKRFADSGGWGWAAFDYDEGSGTFRPANAASRPPQGNDAKCGLACHTDVVTRDYVFTEYGKR